MLTALCQIILKVTAKEIRQIEREAGGRVAMFALTAHATPGHAAECMEAGMDGHLSKPISVDRLVAMLDEVAGRIRENARTGARE